MAAEAQYLGWETGDRGNLPMRQGQSASATWPHAVEVLRVCELVFGVAFTVEVVLKIAAYRLEFVSVAWNWLDSAVVVGWLFEQSGVLLSEHLPIPPLVFRLTRLAKTVRLLRLARSVQFADSLNLMVLSIQASVSVGTWSIVLLSIIMLFVGLVLSHTMRVYIEDLSIDEERRETMYKYFGTCSRSFLTMLELTDGNWVPVTRILQEYISPWASAFIIIYRFVVAFSIIRVITGVFLHETMRVAGSNDELMITQSLRERRGYLWKMHKLFREADNSSDGSMSKDEFLRLLGDERVRAWFCASGLDLRDPDHVWSLFDPHDDSDEIDADKFIGAVTRLRGPAQRVDLASVTQDVHALRRVVDRNTDALQQLAKIHQQLAEHSCLASCGSGASYGRQES